MYDPYAPPAAGPSSPFYGAPVAPGGPPQPWGVTEIMGRAFDLVRQQFGAVMVFNLVYFLMAGTGGFVVGLPLAFLPVDPELRQVIVQVVSLPLSAFLMVGLVRGGLAMARGEPLTVAILVSGGGRTIPMLIAQVLYALIVGFGFLLLIVPGVVLSIGLSLFPYYVADTDLGPVEALKASWEATRGRRLALLGLSFGTALLTVASMLAFCVGLLAGMALPTVALSVVFLRQRGADPFALPGQ